MAKNTYNILDNDRVAVRSVEGQKTAREILDRIGGSLVTDRGYAFTHRRADQFSVLGPSRKLTSTFRIEKVSA